MIVYLTLHQILLLDYHIHVHLQLIVKAHL